VNTDSTAVDAFVAGCASVKGWRKARLAATGKSTGIPHELGSTAYGVVLSIEEAIRNIEMQLDIRSAGVIVEGIGEVGGNAIKILVDKGAAILGVSDVTGALYSESGLDGNILKEVIDGKNTVLQMVGIFKNALFVNKFGGGGVLFDLGSHVLDVMYSLLGEYDSIFARTEIIYPQRPDKNGSLVDIEADDVAFMVAMITHCRMSIMAGQKVLQKLSACSGLRSRGETSRVPSSPSAG